MLRYILLVLCVLEATNAVADAFYVAVRFECDRKNDFVAVHYLGAYNEQGEALIASLDENGMEPWKLVEVTGDKIIKQNTVTKECTLSDGTYKVEIGPAPGNSNIQGRCGAEMSAWAEVSKASESAHRVKR